MTPEKFMNTPISERGSASFSQEVFVALRELEEFCSGIEPAVLSMINDLDSVCGNDICPNCGEFRLLLPEGYADCKHCGDTVPF